jgi:hypothetical protein
MITRRNIAGFAALAAALLVLGLRVRRINQVEPVQLAARAYHVLYLDSLRQELLGFAEQYGRPVFHYDSTPPVTLHGRIQLARLREALFDPRIEYTYGDEGFTLDWRSDPKPPRARGVWVSFGTPTAGWWATAWPSSTVEYAKLRRIAITPQWPEPPRRARPRSQPRATPHNDLTYLLAALATTQ